MSGKSGYHRAGATGRSGAGAGPAANPQRGLPAAEVGGQAAGVVYGTDLHWVMTSDAWSETNERRTTMPTFPRKFVGLCGFDYEPISINRAIWRSDKNIVIEFDSEGYLYTVNLRSDDGQIFKGQFAARKGGDESTGNVDGRLFRDETGLVIVVSWHEEGDCKWFARLNEVDEFPDERERRA